MKKYNIAKVEYKPTGGASPASFRLDLRLFMKHRIPNIYFSKRNINIEIVKNLGCLLFGQPEKWKGVLGIEYHPSSNGWYEIIIYSDGRIGHASELTEAYIHSLLNSVISTMEKEVQFLRNHTVL